jgi:hypothetical protein
MKKLFSAYKLIALAFAILFSINEIKAQCEISLEDGVTMPVCYNEEVRLSVDLNTNYNYEWTYNGDVIDCYYTTDKVYVDVNVTEDNATYYVNVTNAATGSVICNPSITINMRPKFDIDFQQLTLTCSDKNDENGKTAKVKATASGGGYNTFTYHWNSPITPIQYMDNPQIAIQLSAYTNYTITVTNEYGCSQTDTVRLKAYLNPNIQIFSDPADTVYKDNPYVTWSFTNNDTVYNGHDTMIEISNFFWEFDGYENTYTSSRPEVSFTEEGQKYASLTVTNDQGCDTTFRKYINVLPVKLKVPNIFTPNGDGINDYFEVGYDDGKPINDLNKYFLSHKLVIFNRWGRIVYESNDYHNDWDGGNLPDGTYFYVLDCKGETQNYNYKGSVMIWNSGR